MAKPNLFDTADAAVQRNMINDVIAMAKQECHTVIDDAAAARIARRILAGKRTRDALYRVSTARMCKLVR